MQHFKELSAAHIRYAGIIVLNLHSKRNLCEHVLGYMHHRTPDLKIPQ